MKIEIGAMINGMFIKKGSKVKIRSKKAENRNGFYATVIDVDEERIDFLPEYDENEGYFYWDELDLIELSE